MEIFHCHVWLLEGIFCWWKQVTFFSSLDQCHFWLVVSNIWIIYDTFWNHIITFEQTTFSWLFPLVDGLEHFLFFHFIYGIILPIDEVIFFKMVTTNQFFIFLFWETTPKRELKRSYALSGFSKCDKLPAKKPVPSGVHSNTENEVSNNKT